MSLKIERTGFEIAIIGMAGVFPGARNLDEFWKNLIDGRECISRFSEEELLASGVAPELIKQPNYVAAKGVFPDLEYFDLEFFGYTPADAALMDPQVRMLHQGVYHALEDAGYNSADSDRNIGLFAGASGNFTWELDTFLKTAQSSAGQFAALQFNDKDFIATRLAYKLNLRGPAVAIHSACSTSLLAIDMAVRHLYTGACPVAVAAGVGLTLPYKNGYGYEEGMIKSADGSCRAFDNEANGTVEGNGMAAVVLKPLENALDDGDSIYAIIRGIAVNNDGDRKVGYSAPSVEGQAEVIRRALFLAEVDANTISYVEAHGTGTNLGDPVEVEALKKAFRTDRKQFCGLGSLKSNIGHTDVAAGISSFIKTVKALQYKTLPASINIRTPNEKIGFEQSPFFLLEKKQSWKRFIDPEESKNEIPLRAGVSSFGIGGTNVHLILEEAPEPEQSIASLKWHNLCLSANNIEALKRVKLQMQEWIAANPAANPADLAYTLQTGRGNLAYRQAVAYKSLKDLSSKLRAPEHETDIVAQQALRSPRYVFLFPGQGTQYPQMARQLVRDYPQFATHLESCLNECDKLGSTEIRDILLHDDAKAETRLEQTEHTQLSLFAVEYALANLLIDLNIRPHLMLGHSLGEYVAACVAGVFTLAEAIYVVQQRARLMQALPRGSMLAASCSVEKIKQMLPNNLDLAAVNGPTSCTVSGPDEIVQAFSRVLEQEGIQAKILNTSHAFHSRMMEPVLIEYQCVLQHISFSEPRIAYFSNVTGNLIEKNEAVSVDYYLRHIREPVQYHDAAVKLAAEAETIFIEVGAGTVLTNLLKQCSDKFLPTVSMLRHKNLQKEDGEHLQEALGKLWCFGANLDWKKLYLNEQRIKLRLPLYPFNKTPVPIGEGDILTLLSGANSPANVNDANTTSAPKAISANSTGLFCFEWRTVFASAPHDEDSVRPCLCFEYENSNFSSILAKIGGLRSVRITQDHQYSEVNNSNIRLNHDSSLHIRKLLVYLRNKDEMPDTIIIGVDYAKLPDVLLLQKRVLDLLGMSQEELGSKTLTIYIAMQTSSSVNHEERVKLSAWLYQLGRKYPSVRLAIVELLISSRHRNTEAIANAFQGLIKEPDLQPGYYDLRNKVLKVLQLTEVERDVTDSSNLKGEKIALLGPDFLQLSELAAQLEVVTEASVTPFNLPRHFRSNREKTLDLNTLEPELRKCQTAFFEKYGINDLRYVHTLVDRYCLSLLCEFLVHHAYFKVGDVFTAESLANNLQIVPGLTRYAEYFCHQLKLAGYADDHEGKLILKQDLNDYDDPYVLLKEIQSHTRLFDGQLRLVRHAFANYAKAFSGKMQSIEVLYPGGSNSLIRETYQDSIQQLEDELIMGLFYTIVEKLVQGSRKIRILEVGGGYGMAMRRILPLLKNLDEVEFLFTDIGSTFINDAKAYALKHDYDFMHFGIFDITKPEKEQGYENNSFDLIYAYNVVHATPSIRKIISNLEPLLMGGGYMCLLERTNIRAYVDLVWGMADGWWHFDKDERKVSPLMSLEKWQNLLEEFNFAKTICYPQEESIRQHMDMGIIIAQADMRDTVSSPIVESGQFDRVLVLDTNLNRYGEKLVSLSSSTLDKAGYDFYASEVVRWKRANPTSNFIILSDTEMSVNGTNDSRELVTDKLQSDIKATKIYLPFKAGLGKKPYTHTIGTQEKHVRAIQDAARLGISAVFTCTYNNSGTKVERSSFSDETTQSSLSIANSYTELETLVITILRKLFGLDQIRPEDDFFSLGGDSLKVAQFTTELEKYGIDIQPNEVFSFPQISQLSNYLSGKQRSKNLAIDSLTSLAEHLSACLGITVDARDYLVDNKELKVLFIRDEDLLNDKSINALLAELRDQSLPKDVQPDYVAPLSVSVLATESVISSSEFAKVMKLEVADRETIERLIKNAKLQQRRLGFSIIEGKTEDHYAISPFQKMYLKNDNRVSLYHIQLNEIVDRDLLNQAFTDVVRRQGLLRSSLVRATLKRAQWREHQIPNQLSIPSIDLSNFDFVSQDNIIEKLMADEYQTDFDRENSIMYHVLLLRLRLNRSILLFNLDHSIFDNMSGQVLRRQLIDRYKALKAGTKASMPPIKSFKDYLEQINRGPLGISPRQLIDLYQLREYSVYRDKVERFILKNRQPGISRMQYTIDLSVFNPGDSEEAAFETTLQIVAYSLARYIGVNKVPLKIIFQGRKYHDFSFFDTLGLFVDVVPLLLDVSRPFNDMMVDIRNKLSWLNRFNLSFMNMVLNIRNLVKWRDVVSLTAPRKLPKKDPMILLNYAGKAGREYRKIIEFATEKMLNEPNKLDYASFYIIATNDDANLVLDILCNFIPDKKDFDVVIEEIIPTIHKEERSSAAKSMERNEALLIN